MENRYIPNEHSNPPRIDVIIIESETKDRYVQYSPSNGKKCLHIKPYFFCKTREKAWQILRSIYIEKLKSLKEEVIETEAILEEIIKLR